MEERYQARWDTKTDYCWSLKGEEDRNQSRQSRKKEIFAKNV